MIGGLVNPLIAVDGDRDYKSVYIILIIREPHCNKISQGADTYYHIMYITRYIMMQLF